MNDTIHVVMLGYFPSQDKTSRGPGDPKTESLYWYSTREEALEAIDEAKQGGVFGEWRDEWPFSDSGHTLYVADVPAGGRLKTPDTLSGYSVDAIVRAFREVYKRTGKTPTGLEVTRVLLQGAGAQERFNWSEIADRVRYDLRGLELSP